MADKLVIATSTLQPIDEMVNRDGKLNINFRSSIPDNINHWQVFNDDKQVLRFIQNVQEFSDCEVSYQHDGKQYQKNEENVKNHVPSSLIDFEKIFNS